MDTRTLATAFGVTVIGGAALVAGIPSAPLSVSTSEASLPAKVAAARGSDYEPDRSHLAYYVCPRGFVQSLGARMRQSDSPTGDKWSCIETSSPDTAPCTQTAPRTCAIRWRSACGDGRTSLSLPVSCGGPLTLSEIQTIVVDREMVITR